LEEPAPSVGQERLHVADVTDDGYIWDLTRVWAEPEANQQLMGLS
jgi:hypothetical protein